MSEILNNRKEKKLNKERQKLIKKREKSLAKAIKKGRYNKYQKKLLAAKKIGVVVPIEASVDFKMSKKAGFIYTCLLAVMLSMGICFAYKGFNSAIEFEMNMAVISAVVTVTMLLLMVSQNFLGKIPRRCIYGGVAAILVAITFLNRKELLRCVIAFGDIYFDYANDYIRTTKAAYDGTDLTVLFVVLGIFAAMVISVTALSASGCIIFMTMTLPCVALCMLVGYVPDFVWFVMYGLILVGVLCAGGTIGYQDADAKMVYDKLEKRAIKKEKDTKSKEQIITSAYVKVMLTAMAASLAVMLAMSAIYSKEQYEEKEAKEIRADLEDSLVDLEEKINKRFNLDIALTDELTGRVDATIGDGGGAPIAFSDIEGLVDRIKKGGGLGYGAIPEGKIELDSETVRLEVYLGKMDRKIYLKGYTADTYNYSNGRWRFLGDVRYDTYNVVPFLWDLESEGDTPNYQTVIVRNIRENSGAGFVPYFSEQFEYTTEGLTYGTGGRSNTYIRHDTQLDDITAYDFSLRDSQWAQLCQMNRYVSSEELERLGKSYTNMEIIKSEYVGQLIEEWENKGKVENLLQEIYNSNMAGIYGGEYYENKTQYDTLEINEKIIKNTKVVQEYLSENMHYTLNPPKNDTDMDATTFFLAESKKGYCMHFASSAAILLSNLGVPARYVEGYVITEDNYALATKSNRKGDSCDPERKGDVYSAELYMVPVYGANAHAWIEVYLFGIGWVPVEMTKPYSSDGFESVIKEELKDKERPTIPAVTKKPEETKAPEETKKPIKTEKPEETKVPEESKKPEVTNTPQPTKAANTSGEEGDLFRQELNPVIIGILIGILCVALLIGCYAVYRRIRINKIKKMLITTKGTLRYIFKTMERIGNKKGIEYSNNVRYDDYAKELAKGCEFLEEDAAIECMEKISKELFSKEGISKGELEKIKKIYMSFIGQVLDNGNKLYVFYLKHIILVQRNI